MTRIEPLKTARLIRALITTRLRTKPKRPLSMGKAGSFPFPYSSLLVSSKITHLTKLYIGMYRIYSIKLATTSNKRPSLWEENLISAHVPRPPPRPPLPHPPPHPPPATTTTTTATTTNPGVLKWTRKVSGYFFTALSASLVVWPICRYVTLWYIYEAICTREFP